MLDLNPKHSPLSAANSPDEKVSDKPFTSYKIPFNRPSTMGRELERMAAAMSSGHISGDGPFTKQCHTLLEGILPGSRVFLTTSCTHALELSALLLNIQPGDEVIVPSFTFVSTVNAFVLRGAKPVFIDIRPDTLNIDERLIENAITGHTRAIVVVHYAGVACEMNAIMAIAARHGILVIEDNAHGLFGRYQERALGTFGVLATQSFHETKNFTCGEGGALVVNDPTLVDRTEILREKGTNRSRFFRGMVDKYTWVDVGSSWLPSDLLAAYLYAQFEAREDIQAQRKHVWDYYSEHLNAWAKDYGVRMPYIPPDCEQAYHMFYLLMPSLEKRTALIDHLKTHRILAVFHYLPLHVSDMGQRFGGRLGDCPVTENISDRLLRLPFYNTMTDNDLESVVAAVHSFV